MSKLVRLNSETSTIKRAWQGAPVSFSCYKKNCSSWCKQAATVWSWTHSLLCSQTGKRMYGNFSFLPHTRRGQSPPSQWLHDPNLSPIHIYFQHPSRKKIGSINMRGNSSKDTERQLQITLFSPSPFLQDTLHLCRYCLSRPPCKLEDQNTHVQCVCVCLCVGFRDESLDPISCLLPIPISIFALWKLTLVPMCGVCKWLRELAAPFSATAQMHHKRTIWSQRPEQRLSASKFPLPPRT